MRTFRVNVAVPLPARPDVDDDCVRRRSARVVTVPHAATLLLAVCGSDVVVEIFAVLQICVPSPSDEGRCTTSVKASAAPTANDDFAQLIEPVLPAAGVVQVQPDGTVSDLNVALDGNESVS